MKKLIGRKNELKKLKQANLLEANTIIKGAKGTGKTTLVQTFQKQFDKNLLWISADRMRSIEEIIRSEYEQHTSHKSIFKNFETLILEFLKITSDVDGIVWDNFELIPDLYRSVIFDITSKSDFNGVHYFLTKEKLTKKHDVSDFLKIELLNFSKDEVLEFFQEIDAEALSSSSLEKIYSSTLGNPYLIYLYILADGDISNYWLKEYENLNEQQKKTIRLLCLLGRPVSIDRINELIVADDLKTMIDSMIVREINEGREIEVALDVDAFMTHLDEDVWSNSRHDIIKFLNTKLEDPLELLYHLLFTDHVNEVKTLTSQITKNQLHKLESKNIMFLQKLANVSENYYKNTVLEEISQTTLLRVLARCLLLLGQRKEAIAYLNNYLLRFSDVSKYKIQAKLLVLELVQQLNRYGKYDESLRVIKTIVDRTSGSLKTLFLVEQCSAMISIDVNQALYLFDSLLKNTLKDDECREDSYEFNLAMAQLYFQFGRCYYNIDRIDGAEMMFNKSIGIFNSLTKPYFVLVCKLNLCWISYKREDFTQTREMVDSAYQQSMRYGYNYVSAGFRLLSAKIERNDLLFSKALDTIKQAKQLIGDEAPFLPRKDIIMEEIRILLHRGARIEAKLALDEIISLNNQDFLNSSDYRKINTELSIYNLDYVTECESWQRLEYDDFEEEHRALYLMQIGHDEYLSQTKSRSPLQSLMKSLGLIHKDMQNRDNKNIWNHLQRVKSLPAYKQMNNEYYCYVELLSILCEGGTDSLKNKRLASLSSEIGGLEIDKQIKEVLTVSIDNILNPNDSNWGRCSLRDAYRYKLIVDSFIDHNKTKYICMTLDEESYCNSYTIDDEVDYVFIEDLGELYFRGELIVSFSKRKKLRQLLSAFFSMQASVIGRLEIVPIVWGEVYDPFIHDSRVYTSIQRLKKVVGNKDVLMSHDGGYSWNPKFSYKFYKRRVVSANDANTRNEHLLLEVFKSMSSSTNRFITRKTLVEATGLSESQIKREISSLLEKGIIKRFGSGRSVRYSLSY